MSVSEIKCARACLRAPPSPAGEENISVVVAPIRDGFTLRKMGGPEEAALRFLETTGAAEGGWGWGDVGWVLCHKFRCG